MNDWIWGLSVCMPGIRMSCRNLNIKLIFYYYILLNKTYYFILETLFISFSVKKMSLRCSPKHNLNC